MSLSKAYAHPQNKRMRQVLALVLIAPLLAACFRPLHMAREDGSFVRDDLAAITIEAAPGRLHSEVRNELIFLTSSSGRANKADDAKAYRLVFTVLESGLVPIIDTNTGRPQTSVMALEASYKLYEVGKETPIFTGKALGRTSYDRVEQRYASLRAQRQGQDRTAKVVADQIKTQLSAFFASQQR
jgi:LPS-assembly lipoprotein